MEQKKIETPELIIKGNIMSWADTMIQLSNVSCISTSDMELKKFPFWSILVLVVGLSLLERNTLLAFLVVLGGVAWICWWYRQNEELKKNIYLNIVMNSGMTLQILFADGYFLASVLSVMQNIMIEGGVGQSNNVLIHVDRCKIEGNARVLNDLKLNG